MKLVWLVNYIFKPNFHVLNCNHPPSPPLPPKNLVMYSFGQYLVAKYKFTL